jgi:hypothetical protein
MSKFTSVKPINARWRNNDFVGPANSSFTFPNEFHDEFLAEWAYQISVGDIVITETPTTGNVQVSTLTVGDIVLTGTATGNFGGGGGTSTTVIGTSPISVSTSSNTATVSLIANYQTAGTYITGVSAGAPLSVSTSTANIATVSLTANYQTAGTYVTSVSGNSPISATGTTAATISLSSGTAPSNYVLAADGTGGVGWIAQTGGTGGGGGISTIVGTSPISATVLGSSATVSLSANYQTAGTYVNYVIGTSPASVSTTSGTATVSIDASVLSAENSTRTRSLVRNTTVSTIAKGSWVYIDGSSGTVPTIQPANASSDLTSARTFGITETAIASNTDGYVTNQGLITGIDTSSFTDGQVLWLSTTAGVATTTKPTGPTHGVLLGIVVKGGSVGAGSIYVVIKNGAELDEIHDVNISGLADGNTLIYSSTASVWQNKTLANAGIAASTHTHNYQVSGNYATAVSSTAPITSSFSSVGGISISHDTGDGYHHVPATSTTNSGKFLKAGATAGSEAWTSIAQSDVTNLTTDLSTINTAVTSAQTTANTANTTANNAVPKSTVTTKGDIIVASAASAVARLGVGTDGQILTARSTATNGVAWETAAAGGGSSSVSVSSKTASFTIAAGDSGTLYLCSAANITITLPQDSAATYTTGSLIHVLRGGTQTVTFAAGTGATVNYTYGLTLRAQWSAATLLKSAANTWTIIGDTA